MGMKQRDIDWGEQWDPRIYFFNAVSTDKYEVKRRLGLKSPDDDEDDPVPDAQLSIRMKGVFKSTMKLNEFPFDYQNLTIKIMSDWPRKVTEFCKDMSQKDSVRTDTFTGEQEWELQKHVSAHQVEEEKMTSGAVNAYPLYNVVVNVKRKASYYMWNVALIMFLITPLAFTSYAVSADAPEDRLSVTLTLLLTAVAFKFVVSQSLPNTSYQTLLDYYVLWCMMFLCLVVVQNAVASLFSSDKVWEHFDLPSLCVLGGLTVLVNIIFIIISCYKSRKVGHQMQQATSKYNDLCEEIKSNKGRSRNYKESTMGEMSIQEERAPLSNPDPPREKGRYEKV
eukprot:XP_011660458.1 PREDICTED: acetylcholine receptor subunit delta [Strongylocentrotus purpuratus]